MFRSDAGDGGGVRARIEHVEQEADALPQLDPEDGGTVLQADFRLFFRFSTRHLKYLE